MLYAGAAAICRRLRHAAPAGCTQSLRRPAVPLALLGGAALGMGLGLGAVTAPVSAAGTAENDMNDYMKVLVALQSRLDSMSTK
jgi:hypothetical protein|eukprot:COSAG06_NODE_14908_length_1115_cov_1.397638_2_plen_84_part_00